VQIYNEGNIRYTVDEPLEHYALAHRNLSTSVIDLLQAIESHLIINIHLDLFMDALNSALHDVNHIHRELWIIMCKLVPSKRYFDDAAQNDFKLNFPSSTIFVNLKDLHRI
jgi:hypothetical protein